MSSEVVDKKVRYNRFEREMMRQFPGRKWFSLRKELRSRAYSTLSDINLRLIGFFWDEEDQRDYERRIAPCCKALQTDKLSRMTLKDISAEGLRDVIIDYIEIARKKGESALAFCDTVEVNTKEGTVTFGQIVDALMGKE